MNKKLKQEIFDYIDDTSGDTGVLTIEQAVANQFDLPLEQATKIVKAHLTTRRSRPANDADS